MAAFEPNLPHEPSNARTAPVKGNSIFQWLSTVFNRRSTSNHAQVLQGDSFFQYAHSFQIIGPTMVDMSQNNEAMKWLCGHTMQGVEHCSDAREPPPCCHPQTRSALLTEANDWLRAQNSKLRVSLLCGPAGVGKSAIAQTLADCAASENRLGATIFFTNSSSARRERSKLWTTISYLLAVNHLPYSQHVQREIGRNLRLVEHNMKKQFDALIEIPIGRQKLLAGTSHLIPIFIDGLDQFCNPGDREEVVQLILDFVEKHPDAPLAWIITSRSGEYLIKAIDQKVTAQECFQKCLLEIDSPDARKDVRHFLESRFGEIQDQYGIPKPPQWPNKERLDDVSAKASGFFIFAHAVTQFVGDRKAKDPEGRLGVVLQTVPGRGDPLGAVHEMYREILSNVSEEHRSVVKRILGFYCLPRGFGSWRQDTTTFWALCNILGITWQDGDGCLSGLHSLLDIPTIEDAAFQPIRLFHSSFTEYLTSSNCPADFHIDMKEVVSELWQCHFRVMQNAQVPGRSTIQLSNIPLSWALSPEQDQNLRRKIWENARRLFFHYILPCDPLLGCPFGLHPSNVEDLAGILREVRFDNLVDGYAFPDLPFKFLEFLDWIAQEGNSFLQQEGLLKPLTMADRQYGWVRRDMASFRAYTATLSNPEVKGHVTSFTTYAEQASEAPAGIDRSSFISTREPPTPFSELFNDLEAHQNNFASAFVVGSENVGQCVLMMDTSNPNYRFYYVLPYHVV